MAIIASEAEGLGTIKKLHSEYKVGKIVKLLRSRKDCKFPLNARMDEKHHDGISNTRTLRIMSEQDQMDRVARIHSTLGNWLHEFSPYKPWPKEKQSAIATLGHVYKGIRADHQCMPVPLVPALSAGT